jgi:hypothetical protein
LIIEYDTVVVGSSLDALMFAARNFFPVISSDLRKPFRFDYIEPDIDISGLNFSDKLKQTTLATFDGSLEVGLPKQLLWERMLFLLSLSGKLPLSNLCKSLRIEDNKITCFNEYSKIAEIRFNECYYFGDDNLSGARSEKVLDNTDYVCYDWIAFNKGGKHDIDFFETGDDFVKRVWFYPSDRIDGNTAVKDACVLSVLNQEQILDFNFSETMARFKLVSEMEARGMRGLFNGHDSNGRKLYYKFKTSHIKRSKRVTYPGQAPPKAKGLKIAGRHERQNTYKDISQICMDYDRLLRGL